MDYKNYLNAIIDRMTYLISLSEISESQGKELFALLQFKKEIKNEMHEAD